jgi:hypothetical protein
VKQARKLLLHPQRRIHSHKIDKSVQQERRTAAQTKGKDTAIAGWVSKVTMEDKESMGAKFEFRHYQRTPFLESIVRQAEHVEQIRQ